MPPKTNDATEMDRLITALRGIVGALNAQGFNNDNSVPVAIARIETRLDHLERTLNNTQKILIGMGISVLSLVIKMVIEGVILK